MTVMLTGGESRNVLRGVRWEEYLALLADREGTPGRFTFDRGVLEIMTTSFEHENLSGFIFHLIVVLAEELGLEVESAGSLTLTRADLERGTEPDQSFYVRHARRVRGRKRLHLPQDPPPDLVVEVEITRSAISRISLLASMGVPELWRHDGKQLRMYVLNASGELAPAAESKTFPGLTVDVVERFIAERQAKGQVRVAAAFRDWVRGHLKQAGR